MERKRGEVGKEIVKLFGGNARAQEPGDSARQAAGTAPRASETEAQPNQGDRGHPPDDGHAEKIPEEEDEEMEEV